MNKKLKKGILVVFIANLINLIFSLLTNFLLPKYLSIDCYAEIKTYQLYISYVGLLHLGYIDGIYLKYGGKDLSENLESEFYTTRTTLKVFQVSISLILILSSVIQSNLVLAMFALSIFPLNIASFYKFLYQATGEFELYGKAMNITTILTFLVNMSLLFFAKFDQPYLFIISYVIIDLIILFILESYFNLHHNIMKGIIFDFQILIHNIKDGILLTFGNLASMFLTGMDRWFVKILMSTLSFAQYSFAVSIESFLNLAVTPVTTTLYNHLCKNRDKELVKTISGYIVLFATVIPSAAFPVVYIIQRYLSKYSQSINIIYLLFASQMSYVIIRALFVNLYKVDRKQNRYFKKLLLVIFIAFIFNVVLYKLMSIVEAFALGTLLSSIVWLLISIQDFKGYTIEIHEVFFVFTEIIIFLAVGYFFNPIVALLLYVVLSLGCMFIFMRKYAISIFKRIMHYVSNY